jgi:hypothetical protein
VQATSSDLLSAVDRWSSVPPHVQHVAREIEQLATSVSATNRSLSEADFRRAVLAGYPDRVAQRREPRSPRVRLASGAGAFVAAESGVTEGEEDGPGTNVTQDMQSILGLCAAQGMLSRMLRWHYRSRHDSLIALSNADPDKERTKKIGERVGQIAEHHLVRVKSRGIDDDLVLLQVAAHRVDLHDAGHLAEPGSHLPIEQRSEAGAERAGLRGCLHGHGRHLSHSVPSSKRNPI